MLSISGFNVEYLDGINERIPYRRYISHLLKSRPDLIVIEAKTPILRLYWKIIDNIKKIIPDTLFALVGDHVSYNPKESLDNSLIDFVITGGDYDVSLLQLCKYLEEEQNKLPAGIWYREGDKIKNTGKPKLIPNLDILPFIDRILTKWWLYRETYLYQPCTYIMWGRGCYPGKCTFCVWASNFWKCRPRLRSVNNVLDEIDLLIEKLRVKEIFDDTDTSTWNTRWLQKLCEGIIERGINDEVKISCNARADNLDWEMCKLLKKAGFRLLKVGVESGNERTLELIKKGVTVQKIFEGVMNAKRAGLNVLLTFMVGYPWETADSIRETLALAKKLMLYKTHVGDSLQASVVIPYPGTPLYFESIEKNWFKFNPNDYERFDMSEPVLKTLIPSEQVMSFCNKFWTIHLDPRFVINTAFTIRSTDDIKLLWRGIKSILRHKMDF